MNRAGFVFNIQETSLHYPHLRFDNLMYSMSDLDKVNEELLPLKALADRELKSIYGLSGQIYTPHIDAHNEVCLKKAKILLYLKKHGVIPFTEVETTSAKLMALHNRAKNHKVVEFNGNSYECYFSPLKLSKSGKTVRKWAKYWLKKSADGKNDPNWERQIREIWPENFLIKLTDIQ